MIPSLTYIVLITFPSLLSVKGSLIDATKMEGKLPRNVHTDFQMDKNLWAVRLCVLVCIMIIVMIMILMVNKNK